MLADDHPFVVVGMKALFAFDDGVEVVGEASNVSSLLAVLSIQPCDVLVTDFAMPEPGQDAHDGLRLIRRVRQEWPHIGIVVLTSVTNVAILRSILNAGAMSLVNKAEPIEYVVGPSELVEVKGGKGPPRKIVFPRTPRSNIDLNGFLGVWNFADEHARFLSQPPRHHDRS
ncbi:response regulator, partial [Candidatus Burkholderia verschuerenii]|uniref:response regulator n=1 Tax=Candidatus Burkholderia verschuerenii TaxID=242163 RepID=UPI0012EE04C0